MKDNMFPNIRDANDAKEFINSLKKINFVKPIKVNANKIIKSQGNVATLEVRVLATRVWLVKLRFFIGQKLIKLGCWIAYCDYKEVEKKD